MALLSTNAAPLPLLSILLAPFRAIGRFLILIAESNQRVQAVETLSAMSDEELAKRGFKREDIVHHVFKDTFYI